MIDIPPVWLGLALALVWAQDRYVLFGPEPHPLIVAWGLSAIAMGCALIAAAVVAFARHKTTIIPHQVPRRVIQTGIFAWSRNPIYLGDTFILFGVILVAGAWPCLLLVPLFVWWIALHFIEAEEARMRAAFGEEYSRYERIVRRWAGRF